MRIAVYGSLLWGCSLVWATDGNTTCCTFFWSAGLEREWTGTDSAGVKLCCSHALACATCHGDRQPGHYADSATQKAPDTPLGRDLMKRLHGFFQGKRKLLNLDRYWGRKIFITLFIAFHSIKIRWNFCFPQRLGWPHLFWGWEALCSAASSESTKRVQGWKVR